MIVDFGRPILDFDGKELKEGDKVITLGVVSVRALNATFIDEPNIQAEKKLERFDLALIANKGEEADLTPEQIIELKACIAKAWQPLIVGRAREIIPAK